MEQAVTGKNWSTGLGSAVPSLQLPTQPSAAVGVAAQKFALFDVEYRRAITVVQGRQDEQPQDQVY